MKKFLISWTKLVETTCVLLCICVPGIIFSYGHALLLMCLVVNKQLCSTYHARIQKKFRGLGCVWDVDAYMYVILFVGERGGGPRFFSGNFTIGFNEFEFARGGGGPDPL